MNASGVPATGIKNGLGVEHTKAAGLLWVAPIFAFS
jgi:hypothetical protein